MNCALYKCGIIKFDEAIYNDNSISVLTLLLGIAGIPELCNGSAEFVASYLARFARAYERIRQQYMVTTSCWL